MNAEGVSSLQSRYGFARRKTSVHSASKENNSSPKISRKNNVQNCSAKINSNVNPTTSNKTAATFTKLPSKNTKSEPRFGFQSGISNNNIRLRENFIQNEKKRGKVDNSKVLLHSESDNISSSENSQDSDNYNSDISTSDTSVNTNNYANNNIRPFSHLNYKSNVFVQNLSNYSEKAKRVTAVNSEGIPSSPKPTSKFLKKPGSGPLPYKSIGTRASKPIVTVDASDPKTKSAYIERPKTIVSSSSILKFQPTLRTTTPPSQLPGLRASFFNSDHQKLNSANLHNKPVNVYQNKKSEAMIPAERIETHVPTQSSSAFQKPTVTASVISQKKEPSLRSFVQHRNRIKENKIDDTKKETICINNIQMKKDMSTSQQSVPRKWVKKFEPKAKQSSGDSDNDSVRQMKGVEYLSKLRSSNNAILAQHNVTRPRLKSNNFNLPVIQQESIECEDCHDDSLTRTMLSPNETEDDSGIFTSSHSKYSLESLQEEKSSPEESDRFQLSTTETILTQPTVKMSQSWLKKTEDLSKLQELQNKYSRGSSVESQKKVDTNITQSHKTPNVTVISSSDSEELCSRETSPMQLLDELFKTSSNESRIFAKSNLGGIVKDRKLKFEAKIAKSPHNKLVSEVENKKDEQEAKKEPSKRRNFADLKNSYKSSRDFSAISKIHNLALPKTFEVNDKEGTPSLIDTSDSSVTSSSLTSITCSTDPNNQIFQHILNKNPANIMNTSTGSNYSNCPSETKFTSKTTPSPSSCSDNENKDFLIDDDYNDQQELTFYGHDESLDESLFEKVDSLLLKGQEKQENEQNNEKCQDTVNKSEDTTDGPINVCASPIRLPRLEQIIRESAEKPRVRQDSLDTLSGQESIGSDDCMLDFEERQMQDVEEVDESKVPQPRLPLQRDVENEQDKTKPAYNDIIVDEMTQEVIDVKSMLFKLKTILLEAGTANPTQPTNLYANIVNAEADILTSTAANVLNAEKSSDTMKDIPGNVANKAVEENQDLKRQLVFLQQQLVEKDRRIKKLESLVSGGGNSSPVVSTKSRKNSASQM
eukprot:TRINITY_DN4719_c1_g1_i1.p1 TRINITY_DN4719_c1_g1~~TRINITY_DN4719_c1_g1_i1.p1  ORF type:complete len:1044 (-),score=228.11 TRINITY_DN4719_c1_g1_i1:16-3147(-)